MDAFTIKDLENLSGIKAHTIRIWEQRYSFLNPQRTETNIRSYSNKELKTVLNIALLTKYGYRISQIDRMTPDEIQEKILALTQVEARQERLINELIHSMVDLRMEAFESLLNEAIREKGIDRVIPQLIFPFLERVGILWMTNHINPAQEHLVTNIIRQKLIAGIEAATHPLQQYKKAILFLPEGEYHELGLLFMHYLLKSRGIQVWYLGANVPLKDLAYVAKLKRPDFLFAHLTAVAAHFNPEKFLLNLHHRLPDIPILLSGNFTRHYRKTIPPNIQFAHSLAEVMDQIASFG
ncbi:MAG: MerR family transcriptional regulator [Chitinophagaceae bacterium]|nr:MerR family transcriptional regulator [Chitinophagaceae bacterium]